MAGLTPENPIYKQDQTEIAELDRTLSAMTTDMRDKAERRLQDKLRTDLARTGDVESRLNGELASQTYAATSASPKLQRAAELTADIQRLMKRFATVDDSLRSLELETSGPGMAHLALAAAPPVYPVPSRRKLMLLSALPLALLVGAFAAVFLRKRDPRVYTGRDVEDLLGFTPMAVLPAPGGVSSGVMDEYMLRLAGGIDSALRTGGARSFVLTPAGTAVSVESLSLPLAARLGQLGLDVASVTASAMMAAPEGHAVARRIEGHGSFVEARLDELKQTHDLVFVEAPMLLASAETEYLVRSADATILIATSGVTRRADLLQAALLLERLGVKGVGAVLEGLELRFADASFRSALADVERRQSFESRSARVLPHESAAPAPSAPSVAGEASPVMQGRVDAFTAVEDKGAPVLAPQPVELASEAALEDKPEAFAARGGDANPEEIIELPVAAPASGEMMEPSTQEFATVADPESEPEVASANATEEPLPMAMQFLKFEQPEPVAPREQAIPHEQASFAEPPAIERAEPGEQQYAAPEPAQTVHRRAPVRRVQPEPPPSRNWFQKLFQRDAEPVVSIIPDEDDEDQEAAYAKAGAPVVHAAPPARFSAEDLDIPPRTLPSMQTAVPEISPAMHLAAEQVDVPAVHGVSLYAIAPEPEAFAPEPAAAASPSLEAAEALPGRPEAPLAWQQHPVEVPQIISSLPASFEPAVAAMQLPAPAASQPVVEAREIPLPDFADAPAYEAQTLPMYAIPAPMPVASAAMPEPAMAAAPAERESWAHASLPQTIAPAEPAEYAPAAAVAEEPQMEIGALRVHAVPFADEPQSPAARLEVAQAPAQASVQPYPESLQVAPEPFRTGRWEAARPVSRPETAPWRDRRVSGPNAIYRAPERRFNWNTAAAKPLSVMPNVPGQTAAENAGQQGPATQPAAPAAMPGRPPADVQEASVQPARLTRKWGLLSRYENPQDATDTAREREFDAERNAGPHAGQRNYRRG